MNLQDSYKVLQELFDMLYAQPEIPAGLPEERDLLRSQPLYLNKLKSIFSKEPHRQEAALVKYWKGENWAPGAAGAVGGHLAFRCRVYESLALLAKKPGYFKAQPVFDKFASDFFDELWEDAMEHFSARDVVRAMDNVEKANENGE